jgi:hypothetical protein
MKTLASFGAGLVLSLSLSAQAMTLQNTLPIDSINRTLEMKIDQQLAYFLCDEFSIKQKSLFSPPLKVEEFKIDQVDIFLAPDCLCQLSARVM